MQRFYISPVIGDGSIDDTYRAKVDQYGVNFTSIVKDDQTWALVLVNTEDHAALLADADLIALPVDLDYLWASVDESEQQSIKDRLTAVGISTNCIASFKKNREIVRCIGRQIQPTFHESQLSISE